MFLWTGLGQGCLRDHFRRALGPQKWKENERFYGCTKVVQILGVEAGREGKGWTRTNESSYRRSVGGPPLTRPSVSVRAQTVVASTRSTE